MMLKERALNERMFVVSHTMVNSGRLLQEASRHFVGAMHESQKECLLSNEAFNQNAKQLKGNKFRCELFDLHIAQ
jgi:hypothetical protein